MLSTLSVLKPPNTCRRRSGESLAFLLHYRATFLALACGCLLVSTQELFGDRIQCSPPQDRDIRPEVVNAYCWAAATYSVSKAYFEEVGVEVPYPGVGPSEDESEYVYRNYYQYVHLVLFVQALLFYFPHLVWKSVDRDHLKKLYDMLLSTGDNKQDHNDSPSDHVGNSVGNSVNCKSVARPDPSLEAAANYLAERWKTHSEYALKYVFCEMLALFNLVVQCYFLNVFLHGEFIGLGFFFSPYYNSKHLDAPIQAFPLVTNCYLKKYGPSGSLDTIDALCILPTNALNAKIFLFMWAWFVLLLGVTIWSVVNISLSWWLPFYRSIRLRFGRAWFRKTSQEAYVKVLDYSDFGDWFVLGCLRRNLDQLEFKRLMEVLLIKLSSRSRDVKEP